MLQSDSVVTMVFGIGYIGSRLVQELLYQGREVVGVDNLFSSDRRAIDGFTQSPGFHFVEGSIVDADVVDATLASAGEVEAVYLLAAQSSGHPQAATAEYTEEANLRGPRVVLDALVRRPVAAPVVYASSTRVYGSPLPPTVDEATPYGRFGDLSHLTKCYAEKLFEMYAWRYDLICRVVRVGLTYGVSPVMKTDRRFMTAPNLFCLQASQSEPIVVRARDAVALAHVEDVARGLLWAGEQVVESGYTAFNLASEVATIGTIARLVEQISADRAFPPVTVQDLPVTEDDRPLPRVLSALTSAGFVTRRKLVEGLGETLDHFMVRGQ